MQSNQYKCCDSLIREAVNGTYACTGMAHMYCTLMHVCAFATTPTMFCECHIVKVIYVLLD